MSSTSDDRVFVAIGLTTRIGKENTEGVAYLTGPAFRSFVRKEYPESAEHSRDEHHRMFETVRIHLETGIRFYSLSHESYDGQSVEYTLFDPHVITHDGKRLTALSVDAARRRITVPGDEVAFNDLSRETE